MTHKLQLPIPIPQIAMPEWVKGFLLKFDPMISEGTALIGECTAFVSELRDTNRVLQRLLTRQINTQPPSRRGAA